MNMDPHRATQSKRLCGGFYWENNMSEKGGMT